MANVEGKFDFYAEKYDSGRQKLIPCFDDFYSIAVDLIVDAAPQGAIILDIGAGTGLLSRRVAARRRDLSFHLTDISLNMLEVAKGLPGFSDRVAAFSKLSFGEIDQLVGPFPVIMSSLAIHHLNSVEKEELFVKIYRLLVPGGLFVNADQALGATEGIEAVYRSNWLKTVRAKGSSEEQLSAALDRMTEDRMDPLSDQMDWLAAAGFSAVNTWYQNYSFCVYSAKK